MWQGVCRGYSFGLATAIAALALALGGAVPASASTPGHGTVKLGSNGKGRIAWKGTVGSTPTTLGGTTDSCFGADRKPDPTAGCDFFVLRVDAPESIVQRWVGSIDVTAGGFGASDLDLGVYVHNPNGTVGYPIAAPDKVAPGGNGFGQSETFPIENPTGPARSYYIVLVPYTAAPGTPYNGAATFKLKPAKPSLAALNKALGPGPANYRASHDRFISHSEPSIAMDPLNHSHLIAGSKMYESLPRYLFKIGTYESFDGGRSWKDQGQLPGYCKVASQCDPNDEEGYRTVSDIAMAFDDEGNAYGNVLDAPGGTLAFTGFNLNVHIKKPGKPWTGPILVHDNQTNPITQQTLLDDKNWIAVDNSTDVNGGPNKPRDGKVGMLYVCWSLDVSISVPGQQIVLMRSRDAGQHWFGLTDGDNTPQQLSQKGVVSGTGCHVAVGPHGEVYVTWYDNQADALMQVKSTDRGQTFTPARPIATIHGIVDPFVGQQFRNLSIPTSGVDSKGNVYVAVASINSEGAPVVASAVDSLDLKHPGIRDPREEPAAGTAKPGSGSDIVLFKSTDGGSSYSGPKRVNQDNPKGDGDQFQPWLAITPKGQLDISYFDRRNDGNDLFINTFLSRSNDGGKSFHDTRVTRRAWDPRVNPPTSASGEFIGDYQGIVADDKVAIPFWNDTQASSLPKGGGFSPWQEVYAARIPNHVPGCVDRLAPRTSLPSRNVTLTARRVSFHGTAHDTGCNGQVKRVTVSVARLQQGQCRFLKADGSFTGERSCSKRVLLAAQGTSQWSFSSTAQLPTGDYRATATARDGAGNVERPVVGRNTVRFQVR